MPAAPALAEGCFTVLHCPALAAELVVRMMLLGQYECTLLLVPLAAAGAVSVCHSVPACSGAQLLPEPPGVLPGQAAAPAAPRAGSQLTGGKGGTGWLPLTHQGVKAFILLHVSVVLEVYFATAALIKIDGVLPVAVITYLAYQQPDPYCAQCALLPVLAVRCCTGLSTTCLW